MPLTLPHDFDIEDLWSGEGSGPVPNLAAFDKLPETDDARKVAWLNKWLEPQTTIDNLLAHHGAKGCGKVLAGVARASSNLKVPMSPRVRHYAEALGLKVY